MENLFQESVHFTAEAIIGTRPARSGVGVLSLRVSTVLASLRRWRPPLRATPPPPERSQLSASSFIIEDGVLRNTHPARPRAPAALPLWRARLPGRPARAPQSASPGRCRPWSPSAMSPIWAGIEQRDKLVDRRAAREGHRVERPAASDARRSPPAAREPSSRPSPGPVRRQRTAFRRESRRALRPAAAKSTRLPRTHLTRLSIGPSRGRPRLEERTEPALDRLSGLRATAQMPSPPAQARSSRARHPPEEDHRRRSCCVRISPVVPGGAGHGASASSHESGGRSRWRDLATVAPARAAAWRTPPPAPAPT